MGMTNQELLDLYSEYLVSAFGQTTATGLSTLLDETISHDRVQRFLASDPRDSADLWQIVKPHLRKMERDDGVMIVDDSIAEKPYPDENDIICWHYDHAQDRTVKGINFLTALYHCGGVSLPVGFEVIAKTEHYVDKKNGKAKRRSPITKNELYRTLRQPAVKNRIRFHYVLNDVWYSGADNMKFVNHNLHKDFIMPIKKNRKVAVSLAERRQGQSGQVETLDLEAGTVREIYLEEVDFLLHLVKQVFTNEDGSVGVRYRVTSDTTLSYDDILAIYHKRWNVEPYHRSLKQNASLEKSPTQTLNTQRNHFFAALCGYVKLELLKKSTKLNHFALKSKLYVKALHSAYDALQQLQPVQLAA